MAELKLGMFNEEGTCVDLYIPRRCDYTNKLLCSKDKSSVQLNIAKVFLKTLIQITLFIFNIYVFSIRSIKMVRL